MGMSMEAPVGQQKCVRSTPGGDVHGMGSGMSRGSKTDGKGRNRVHVGRGGRAREGRRAERRHAQRFGSYACFLPGRGRTHAPVLLRNMVKHEDGPNLAEILALALRWR